MRWERESFARSDGVRNGRSDPRLAGANLSGSGGRSVNRAKGSDRHRVTAKTRNARSPARRASARSRRRASSLSNSGRGPEAGRRVDTAGPRLKAYGRDATTANVLRQITRRLNRYQTLCGREADEYLDKLEDYAARWVLVLYEEIQRLTLALRSERARNRRVPRRS